MRAPRSRMYGSVIAHTEPYGGEVLVVVGDLLEDIVVRLAAEPARGTDTPATIERRRGGSAANVAAGAAAAGAAVRFIGRIGDDEPGERLADELAAAGVDVRVQRHGRTGAVVVLVGPDAERTMLPDRGAAVELADVDPSWIDGITWFHFPSYSLLAEPIGATSTQLIRESRAAGARVSIDASSVAVIESYGPDRCASLLAQLQPDVLFANADEERLLPATGRWTTVVKDGPHPVRVRDAGGQIEIDVPSMTGVVDTTGAGDAFAAGYIVAAMHGADPRRAAEAGIVLASRVLHR